MLFLDLWIYTVLAVLFLKVCSGQDIPCTVSQDAELTNYTIPEFNATDCQYRWTNGTDYVLANHKAHITELVAMNSNRTLLTHRCSELIYYIRDCISEGMQHRAICTTNCSRNAGLQHGGGGDKIKKTPHSHWIVPVVVTLVLLLVVLVLFFLCCRYTPVKKQYCPSSVVVV